MHLVAPFLGYLGHLLVNLGMIYTKYQISQLVRGIKYIIVYKGVKKICTKEYRNSDFLPSLF